jgi:hypothetical protein
MKRNLFSLLLAAMLVFSLPSAEIYSDEDCPTACINGKLYEMVYDGQGGCQVENLNPIQTCPYGCIEDNPHAGCAPGPSDSGSSPQPSQQSATPASCTQPGATPTDSGCKADSRCASGCPEDEFQLTYPSCTCFEADFGDKLAFILGPSVQITDAATGHTHTEGKWYGDIGDAIKTPNGMALMVFPDGSYFRLDEDSEAEVDVGGFFLREGGCWVKVEKGEQNEFYIKMETLSTGARGTTFYAWNNEDEEGVRAIEGTIFVQVTNPGSGGTYTLDLPSGSEVIFDRSRNEVQVFEGDGQTLTQEYDEFVESSGNMFIVYNNRGENDLCCTPALALAVALASALVIRRK